MSNPDPERSKLILSKVGGHFEITAAQCRAARALLDWSQDRLVKEAVVSRKTLTDFERELRRPYDRTLNAIRAALEAAGVEFIEENGGGPGVRLKKP
jgi:transcriptional regulator with XRE-family HTH domain